MGLDALPLLRRIDELTPLSPGLLQLGDGAGRDVFQFDRPVEYSLNERDCVVLRRRAGVPRSPFQNVVFFKGANLGRLPDGAEKTL